jgi:hypothetical protein
MWGKYLITLEMIFPMVYNMPQSKLIWPLFLMDLWPRVKFPIWLSPFILIIIMQTMPEWTMQWQWTMQWHFKHLCFKTLLMVSWGLIWCLFDILIKVLNVHNFCMGAIPKVGVHLGVIGLHPLHFPPFLRVCFTPKHILLASWALAFHT